MTEPVRSEVREFVRTITLDHPPGNATDSALMVKLLELVPVANHDWDTRVVVLQSAVPGVFSLGVDHAEPKPPSNEPRDSFGVPSTQDALVRHFLRGLWDLKWPLIAKVQGTATGNGLLLAALADVAVVSEDALLGLTDARAGVVNGAAVLRRCLTEQAMRYLILSGRTVPARELRALGCGMMIVPADAVDATTDALARDIAAHDPHLLRHLKSSLTELEGDSALAGHAVEQRYTALVKAKLG
jgi:enoyl-CoA hydratase